MTNTIRGLVAAVLLVSSTYGQWTPSPLCPFPSEDLVRAPYEGDCSRYWECYQGARYPMTCPTGLEYNAAESRCDSPEIAKCNPDATIIYPTYSHSTVSTQSTASTIDPGPLPECPFPSEELTFFPVANNCSQYWECYQGSRFLMSCPSGLFWNEKLSYCDYQTNVNCKLTSSSDSTGTTPTTVTTQSAPTAIPNNSCDHQADGTYLPDPNDCSRYYECVSGKVKEGKCPDDLVWNTSALTCDYPANVNCNR